MPYSIRYSYDENVIIPPPKHLKTIISSAEKLAWDFSQVRVDFYITNNSFYFGELTFTQGSGIVEMKPLEFALELGSYIK